MTLKLMGEDLWTIFRNHGTTCPNVFAGFQSAPFEKKYGAETYNELCWLREDRTDEAQKILCEPDDDKEQCMKHKLLECIHNDFSMVKFPPNKQLSFETLPGIHLPPYWFGPGGIPCGVGHELEQCSNIPLATFEKDGYNDPINQSMAKQYYYGRFLGEERYSHGNRHYQEGKHMCFLFTLDQFFKSC